MSPRVILSLLLVGLCVDRFEATDGDPDNENSGTGSKNFEVDIKGRTVNIICPGGQSSTLKKGSFESNGKDEHSLENYSSDKNGLYTCDGYYLYLHAYVCDTCTEVSFLMVASVVIADCLITIGVCVFVYMFCKRKPSQPRESGFAKGARKKGNKERPPPVPNPDYEPIQKKRQDLYDGLNQNLK